MKKSLVELRYERQRLSERIATERLAIAQQLAPFQRAAETSEKATALVQRVSAWLRRHPLGVAAALGLLAALRPRTSLRWAQRGWLLWRGWRAVRQWQPMQLLQQLRRFL